MYEEGLALWGIGSKGWGTLCRSGFVTPRPDPAILGHRRTQTAL